MERARVVLRLVHLGDKADKGIQAGMVQFDEGLIRQSRTIG